MKKIKIAQIGTGHDHAGVTFATLRRMTDVFDVVGYAEVSEDKIKDSSGKEYDKCDPWGYEGAKKYSVEEILSMPDLDAVTIETFDLNIVKYAKMAAERGLHIQMDKATGESAEEFEEFLSLIKRKNLVFNMGYMYRYNPAIERVFECVKRGEIGKVYSVDAEMSCYHKKQKREWLGLLQGGMMQFLGCHLIDLIVRLNGVPDEIIPYNFSTLADGVNSKDVAFAVLKYPNGISTVKCSALDTGGFIRRHLIINGEKGTIKICPLEQYESPGMYAMTTEYFNGENWLDLGKETKSEIFDRYKGMLNEFSRMIRGERGLEIDLQTEARVARCLLVACGIKCDFKGKIDL